MFYRATLLTALLTMTPLGLADSPPPVVLVDDKPGPLLPDVQQQNVTPTPNPNPTPNTSAIVLSGDRQYVTRWRVRFDVECFPDAGLINIESMVLDTKAGEKMFRVFGRFVDGDQALRWQKFPEEFVQIITAKEGAVGQVDCLFIVDGQTKPRKRVTLSVNGGAPAPAPPGPTPPGPTPPGPTPPPVPTTKTKFRIVVVQDVGDPSPEFTAVVQNGLLNATMKERGHQWRIVKANVVDKDGLSPKDLRAIFALARATKLPQVFLVDEDGVLRHQENFPTKPQDLQAMIEKYGG